MSRRAGQACRWSRPCPAGAPRWDDDAGMASLTFPLLVWVVVVAGIAIVDVGAYLVAAARAQQAADAAALAAVAADIDGHGAPRDAASAVVAAGDGRLEACDCRAAATRQSVAVSMAVPGLVVPRFAAARVTATAAAEAVEFRPGHPVAGPAGSAATLGTLDR